MPPKKKLVEFNVKEFDPNTIPISAGMLIVAPPGSGKCLGKGTGVLKFDGAIVRVESIVPGDLLVGDDLEPRRVVTTTRGRSELYRIVPHSPDYDGYVANIEHQVTCLNESGQVIDPTVADLASRGTEGLKLFGLQVPSLGEPGVSSLSGKTSSLIQAQMAVASFRSSGNRGCVSYLDGIYHFEGSKVDRPRERSTGFSLMSLGEGDYYGFSLERLSGSPRGESDYRFLLGDLLVTHNSSFIEELMRQRKHIYPVCRLWIGNIDGYERAKKIYPPLFISKDFIEDDLKAVIRRQETQIAKYPPGAVETRAAIVIDDAGGEKTFRSLTVQNVAKVGSQHWQLFAIFATQYTFDFPPAFREAVSYIAVGKIFTQSSRNTLWSMVGAMVGSRKAFEDLMDKTNGHVFIIFNRRSSSDEIENLISWYQTSKMEEEPSWTFGCPEYREYGRQRYNPDYVESLFI